MFRPFLRLALGLVLLTSASFAGTITSVHVELGTWNGTVFTPDGSDWNTFNSFNWAIGVTAPGFGNPVLNTFPTLSVPDGHYYLYMAEFQDFATALRLTLGYSGGPDVSAVYTSAGGVEYSGPYAVAGSGFLLQLVTAPQGTHTTVSEGQNYFPTPGQNNWVLDLDSNVTIPEPGSMVLLAAGIGALCLIRRRLPR